MRAHTHTHQPGFLSLLHKQNKKVAQCLEQGCGFVFSLLLQQLYTLVLLTAHQHILLRFAGDSELPKLGHAPCMSGQKRRCVNHHRNHNQFKIPRKQKGKNSSYKLRWFSLSDRFLSHAKWLPDTKQLFHKKSLRRIHC